MNASSPLRAVTERLLTGADLGADEAADAVRAIMDGQASDAQIAGFLIALRAKGECVDELVGAARAMRALSVRVPLELPGLTDCCGTGGDGAGLFNVSTAAGIVAAAGGVPVAKHGNRAVSGRSGSADLLEAAGAVLDLDPERIARCVRAVGFGFMFAPAHHAAMKHAAAARRELGVRTAFNLLGPLTNPAGARRQLLGVFDRAWLRRIAETLRALGSERALVVHSTDGLDEISLAAATEVAELDADGQIREYVIEPAALGIAPQPLDSLVVDGADDSVQRLRGAFDGSDSAARGIVALNAGGVLYVGGAVADLASGVAMASDLMDSGQAAEKLREFVEFTRLAASAGAG